ncbi:hypothetical protein [Streptomyces rubiginosohelvolus]|uniref:hypothetical protein n=1 Tax=Streptomyces rubiginosohelvolus TaxID=67362 RepID=UPI0033AB19A8
MTAPPPRVRVAAYVIRRHPSPALLVFDQPAFPEAGTQVPAGGVAPGWEHRVRGDGGDAGMRFVCRFAPLPLAYPLADAQHAHLRRVDPRWAAPGEAAGRPDGARPLS